MTSVNSTNIDSVGYNADTQILTVQFKVSGQVYEYLNVPQTLYEGLMASESKGTYLNDNIRNQFAYRRA
ncbi:MAG: KTSC domain-containing protein [Lachnospiraceae bacterium]|nr:KTSC domain-containing protein [Lachnospiraceae bacterium]MBO5425401.1 KTSC domain-containing protein [Lachnospiraceae bacterium]